MGEEPQPSLSRVLTLNWNLTLATKALGYKPETLRYWLSDGRNVSRMVADYLDNHGFKKIPDGASGFLFKYGEPEITLRLRVASTKLSLAPSNTKGSQRDFKKSAMELELEKIDGWLIVFLCDLPKAPVYWMNMEFAEVLLAKNLLDDKFSGNQRGIHDLFEKECSSSTIAVANVAG